MKCKANHPKGCSFRYPERAQSLNGLARRIEALCKAVAPADLAGFPVYVAFVSRLPKSFTAGACGYTVAWLDTLLHPYVDWRGRGVAMVLDDNIACEEINQLLPNIPKSRARRYAFSNLTRTALHELAHALENEALFFDPPNPAMAADDLKGWASSGRLEIEAGRVAPVDLTDHGAGFTRLAIHIHRRAERLGFQTPLGGLCAGRQYQMRDALLYQMALGDEPARLAGATFAEIRATPIPEIFQAMFDYDRRIAAEHGAG